MIMIIVMDYFELLKVVKEKQKSTNSNFRVGTYIMYFQLFRGSPNKASN